jgi:hypothetical protein
MTAQDFRILIIRDARAAAKELLARLKKHGVHRGEVAREFGISRTTTISEWIRDLGIEAEVDRMRDLAKRQGWFHDGYAKGGRPKGAKDSYQRIRGSAA